MIISCILLISVLINVAEASENSLGNSNCHDRYPFCSKYAADGHCELNPGFMILNCPFACNACHLRDSAVRCTREYLNISSAPAFLPGEMESMFGSLKQAYKSAYDIRILSQDPFVVTFENFLSYDEAHALIARQTRWQRSTETGQSDAFGATGRVSSAARTSSTSWCIGPECENDPDVANVVRRMEQITGLHKDLFEPIQVLQYTLGQRYTVHHDHAPVDSASDRPAGARALTFFLYLSDVDEGGETHFPALNISIVPRRGKAVLWQNTRGVGYQEMDERTLHEALPVSRGVKYAANVWIHLYDYEKSNLWACTGTMG
jgi:hypothetical protein